MTFLKKILFGIVIYLLAVPFANVSYASQTEQSSIHNNVQAYTITPEEDYTADVNVTYYAESNTLNIQVVDRHTNETIFQQANVTMETICSWRNKPKMRVTFFYVT